MPDVSVIIPFRTRGNDPLRKANLDRILQQWNGWHVHIASDGRTGDAQFNRHAAYNSGTAHTTADILIYAESDMLINPEQIHQAITQADSAPGLVVPFTLYRYLTPEDSEQVRAGNLQPETCTPQFTKPNPRRVGAINVLSRTTLNTIGRWDPNFEGNWWDDRSMHRAFDICAAPTRWIDGPAHHLYHLPGWQGDHLTGADRAATNRNKRRWQLYQQASTPEQIHKLTRQ